MKNWQEFDLDQTIYDYEFTKKAVRNMNNVIDSKHFEEMDSDAIFSYISSKIEIVLFPDYLKRYLYEISDLDGDYNEIPDEEYIDILSNAMTDNKAPYSFLPTTTKKMATIKGWFKYPTVKRSTIFILGFVLRMPPEDVSDFLTKVIKETDFDFYDPIETIFWYCFQNDLPYSQALKLKEQYEEILPSDLDESTWLSISKLPTFYIKSLPGLFQYLDMLKAKKTPSKEELIYNKYLDLYNRCCIIVADMFNNDSLIIDESSNRTTYLPTDITPADIEKMLCSGIPVNQKGNLEKSTRSRLSSLFQSKRMSRQRISSILNKQHGIERFDLITLLFFIYAQTVEPDWPTERFLQYIDEINSILQDCNMEEIYPVNPYESFILLCLITESPLETYAEIWEKSYEQV